MCWLAVQYSNVIVMFVQQLSLYLSLHHIISAFVAIVYFVFCFRFIVTNDDRAIEHTQSFRMSMSHVFALFPFASFLRSHIVLLEFHNICTCGSCLIWLHCVCDFICYYFVSVMRNHVHKMTLTLKLIFWFFALFISPLLTRYARTYIHILLPCEVQN